MDEFWEHSNPSTRSLIYIVMFLRLDLPPKPGLPRLPAHFQPSLLPRLLSGHPCHQRVAAMVSAILDSLYHLEWTIPMTLGVSKQEPHKNGLDLISGISKWVQGFHLCQPFSIWIPLQGGPPPHYIRWQGKVDLRWWLKFCFLEAPWNRESTGSENKIK